MNDLLKSLSQKDIEKFQLLKSVFGSEAAGIRQVTLKEFCDEYLEYAKHNLSAKYGSSINQAIKHLLTFFSPIRPVDSIKLIDVEKFVVKIRSSAPSGYRVYVRTLKAAFNKAKGWSYLNENPFEKLKLPKVQKNVVDYISKAEVLEIIEAAETQLMKDVILTAFNTGMRVAEITNLRNSGVDLKSRMITVGNTQFTTKSRKVRFVPINDVMLEIFSRRIKDTGKDRYVFGKDNGMAYTTDYFSKKFKETLRKTNIKQNYCFHSLRGAFASHLSQQGAPPVTISKLLGHSNLSTTMIYVKVNLDDLRKGIGMM